MSVAWFPERLNAAILESFPVSLAHAAEDANAHSSAHSGAAPVQTGPTTGALHPTGIGRFQEEGARPHVIAPKGGPVLFLKGPNVFVSGPVHHPGRAARPYLHPAAARWASGGYQRTARGVLASRGF